MGDSLGFDPQTGWQAFHDCHQPGAMGLAGGEETQHLSGC
jgi:hypothetical protein